MNLGMKMKNLTQIIHMIKDIINKFNKVNFNLKLIIISLINNSNFLGLINNIEYLINFTATECTYPINQEHANACR